MQDPREGGRQRLEGLCQQSDGGLMRHRREYLDRKLGGGGGDVEHVHGWEWMKMKGYLGRGERSGRG
jgi:hypothetical protein